jgi:uncharacterized protein (TIGR00725 family)
MAAASEGAASAGGLVIAVRPDGDRVTAVRPDGDRGPVGVHAATIVTNMGQARNAILVWSADAVIAVGGSWGTLSGPG